MARNRIVAFVCILLVSGCASNGELGFSGHPLDCAIGVGHSDCAPGTPGAARYDREGNTTAQDLAAIAAASRGFTPVVAPPPPFAPSPATLEGTIDGEYHGWTGNDVYRLLDGSVWQQAAYHYHYHYAYNPQVIIFASPSGTTMHVVGDQDSDVAVSRLR